MSEEFKESAIVRYRHEQMLVRYVKDIDVDGSIYIQRKIFPVAYELIKVKENGTVFIYEYSYYNSNPVRVLYHSLDAEIYKTLKNIANPALAYDLLHQLLVRNALQANFSQDEQRTDTIENAQ